jgi:hypothetical protein
MTIDPIIFKAIIALLGILISIVGVIGGLMVKSFYKMAFDLEEIKKMLEVHATKHEIYQKQLEDHEERIRELEHD